LFASGESAKFLNMETEENKEKVNSTTKTPKAILFTQKEA
jgi:hypothetical protein